MDISFIITSLILVSSVFVPFFLFNSIGQSESKKMKVTFGQIVTKNGLNITESENWGIRYLGIDTVQRKVVFLKKIPSEDGVQLIDLNSIKSCEITEKRKLIKTNGRRELLLEKLDLDILLTNGNQVQLSFYDIADNQTEDLELQRAEKWKAILTGLRLTIPIRKKAA